MTFIEKLETIIAHPRKNGIYKNRVVDSLRELREKGFARTGYSYKTGADCWTAEVVQVLKDLNIKCEFGNDAPRGGKNGEFVKLTSAAMIKVIRKEMAERKKIADAEKQHQQDTYNNMINTVEKIKNGLLDDFLRTNKERILQERPNKSTKKAFWDRIAKSLNTYNCMHIRDAINARLVILSTNW